MAIVQIPALTKLTVAEVVLPESDSSPATVHTVVSTEEKLNRNPRLLSAEIVAEPALNSCVPGFMKFEIVWEFLPIAAVAADSEVADP